MRSDSNSLIVTDQIAYSDTFRNSEKCQCKQFAPHCVTVTDIIVTNWVCSHFMTIYATLVPHTIDISGVQF